MLRFCAMFGMAALFLLISGELRATVLQGLGKATFELAKYSPYSYVALGVILCAGAVMSLAPSKPQ